MKVVLFTLKQVKLSNNFTNNNASFLYGGAIYCTQANIKHSEFRNNFARANGGAVNARNGGKIDAVYS